MANENRPDFEREGNAAQRDPENIREQVEALKEKVSGLSDTLGKVEKALEDES
jgi:hypothetical protein